MDAKEVLLEQMSACFDESGWFASLTQALEGLDAQRASWKQPGIDHSIWEIVRHLNFYNHAYLERFQGRAFEYGIEDNAESFVVQPADWSDENWRRERTRLDEILSTLRSLAQAATNDRFDEPVSATRHDVWATLFAHLNLHNAHHGGQVVLIRKLQGSWKPELSVS